MSHPHTQSSSTSTWHNRIYDQQPLPLFKIADLNERTLLLRTLCDPFPSECEQLRYLSVNQWNRLLRWLHTSGLALYIFDRLGSISRSDILPQPILGALQRNLEDNSLRTNALICQLESLDYELTRAGIRFAVLKGFSLFPDSVPHPELRSQLDLDLLLEPNDLCTARKILERRGYTLHAASNRTWEFKTPRAGSKTLGTMYCARQFESIELHVNGGGYLLTRSEYKNFRGLTLPVLSRPDVLLGQSRHLLKHVCDGFVRTAHFHEFRQNVITQAADITFWRNLQEAEAGVAESWLSIGLAISLVTQCMGHFAPTELTRWTVDRLPPRIRLWATTYGDRAVLGDFPGTKLSLLLQPELRSAGLKSLSRRSNNLFPTRLPRAIEVPGDPESLVLRLSRYKRQVSYVLFRFRFHLIEGVRYLYESFQWRRQLRGIVQ